MKNVLIAIILLVFTSTTAFAQWTTSGSNIYNTNSGNVGIGTTSPWKPLTVTGTINTWKSFLTQGYDADLAGQGGYIMWNYSTVTDCCQGETDFINNQGLGVAGGFRWYNTPQSGSPVNFLMSLTANGNLGIGTQNPACKLDVKGSAIFGTTKQMTLNPDYSGVGELPSGAYVGTNGANSLSIGASTNQAAVGAKVVLCYANPYWTSALEVANVASGYGNLLLMKSGGNVGMGTTSPQAKLDVNGNIYSNGKIFIGTPDANTSTKIAPYSLAVNGSAVFTKAVVKLNSAWPDYVFAPSYKMPKLDSLEQFIKANGHLPEIPTTENVEKDGIDLGSNQALLLKKIEELTLIVIEQNKRIQNLEKENQMKSQEKE